MHHQHGRKVLSLCLSCEKLISSEADEPIRLARRLRGDLVVSASVCILALLACIGVRRCGVQLHVMSELRCRQQVVLVCQQEFRISTSTADNIDRH